MANVIRWQGDDTFEQEVVGESHYQESLHKLTGGERRKYTTARLVCESDNKFDSQAVRVEIGGKTIGHLSREDARAHRALLMRAGQGGSIVELPAVIATGERGVSGVYLSVTEADARAMLAPKANAVKPVGADKPIGDRVIIGLVIALAVIGITLMVIGFGGGGRSGVQPTATKGNLSDYFKTHPIVTVVP